MREVTALAVEATKGERVWLLAEGQGQRAGRSQGSRNRWSGLEHLDVTRIALLHINYVIHMSPPGLIASMILI